MRTERQTSRHKILFAFLGASVVSILGSIALLAGAVYIH
jgi:hypothetical protein